MNLNTLPITNTKVSWFYLREERGPLRERGALKTEKHRVGCVAFVRNSDGSTRMAFSLAVKGDQFCAKIGREKAIQKLHSDKHSKVITGEPCKKLQDFARYDLPNLEDAINRHTMHYLLYSNLNQSAYEGALKEFHEKVVA